MIKKKTTLALISLVYSSCLDAQLSLSDTVPLSYSHPFPFSRQKGPPPRSQDPSFYSPTTVKNLHNDIDMRMYHGHRLYKSQLCWLLHTQEPAMDAVAAALGRGDSC